MLELSSNKKPATALEIARCVSNTRRELDDSLAWLQKALIRSSAKAPHVRFYAKRVYENYRSTIASGELIGASESLDTGAETDAVLQQVSELSEKLPANIGEDRADDTSIALELIERIEGKKIMGLRTGIRGIDDYVEAFEPSSLVVLGGRTGSGKSVFLSQFAWHVVSVFDLGAIIFALEMSRIEVLERLPVAAPGVGAGTGLQVPLDLVAHRRTSP
jgi:replicative DNA helicase